KANTGRAAEQWPSGPVVAPGGAAARDGHAGRRPGGRIAVAWGETPGAQAARHAQPELALNAITRPAQDIAPMGGNTLAARLEAKYPGRVTGSLLLPGQGGDYAPLPEDLPEPLARALRARGIDRLYSHQARAWAATQAGRHLVV